MILRKDEKIDGVCSISLIAAISARAANPRLTPGLRAGICANMNSALCASQASEAALNYLTKSVLGVGSKLLLVIS